MAIRAPEAECTINARVNGESVTATVSARQLLSDAVDADIDIVSKPITPARVHALLRDASR